jgi:hypothetical protein
MLIPSRERKGGVHCAKEQGFGGTPSRERAEQEAEEGSSRLYQARKACDRWEKVGRRWL